MYSCLNKSHEITSEVIRTKWSSNVHRAFTVHLAFLFALPSRFACARRSHPLNQFHSAFFHRSFTHHALCLRSTFFQRALYQFTFTLRSCVNIERFRDCIIIFRQSSLQLFILSLQTF